VSADSDGTVVDSNEVVGNHTAGIDVDNVSTTIKKNEARSNGGFGISAPPGVIDGGGNEASHNADGGCTGVSCD
jgi:parallel beta-helix repeat protein